MKIQNNRLYCKKKIRIKKPGAVAVKSITDTGPLPFAVKAVILTV